ncbi:MAG: hypothetical protein EPN26_02735 [Rhodospirillales bacterium]|nr:MAG: hypothetical protein EPN26_02735 [Rhodospirillales bacterium]
MSDTDEALSILAQALAELSGRLDAIEQTQNAVLSSINRERDVQRQTFSLLVQLLERQAASLKQIDEKVTMRRQTTVKGQVVVGRPMQPKPAPQPQNKPVAKPKTQTEPADPPPLLEPVAEPEIEQQISQAIGNISAMLKKKETRKRKG